MFSVKIWHTLRTLPNTVTMTFKYMVIKLVKYIFHVTNKSKNITHTRAVIVLKKKSQI